MSERLNRVVLCESVYISRANEYSRAKKRKEKKLMDNFSRLRLCSEIRVHGLNLGLVLQRRRLRPLRSSRRRRRRGLEFRHVSLQLGVDATLGVGATNRAEKKMGKEKLFYMKARY